MKKAKNKNRDDQKKRTSHKAVESVHEAGRRSMVERFMKKL